MVSGGDLPIDNFSGYGNSNPYRNEIPAYTS